MSQTAARVAHYPSLAYNGRATRPRRGGAPMQNRTPNPPTPPANGHGERIAARVAAARAATNAVRRAAQPMSPGAVSAEGPAYVTAKPATQGRRETLNIRTVQHGPFTW